MLGSVISACLHVIIIAYHHVRSSACQISACLHISTSRWLFVCMSRNSNISECQLCSIPADYHVNISVCQYVSVSLVQPIKSIYHLVKISTHLFANFKISCCYNFSLLKGCPVILSTKVRCQRLHFMSP